MWIRASNMGAVIVEDWLFSLLQDYGWLMTFLGPVKHSYSWRCVEGFDSRTTGKE